MTTFIFTWNPSRWPVEEILKLKNELEIKGTAKTRWRCISKKQVKKGDRAFMVKVGAKPRGIFASGFITGKTRDELHWQDKNKIVAYAPIEFDHISNPENSYEIYLLEDLQREISDKHALWNPQGSGVPIPQNLESILEGHWTEFLKRKGLSNSSHSMNFSDSVDDIRTIYNDKSIDETEKEILAKSRIGQGLFRNRVKSLWQDVCSVTGCKKTDLLRASHIKPWRDSDNTERLDGYNGLLLTPNLDALFDQGLISFADDGNILISDELAPIDIEILGISQGMRLRKIPTESLKYLEYHRSIFFRK